jgi:hypothetical protein
MRSKWVRRGVVVACLVAALTVFIHYSERTITVPIRDGVASDGSATLGIRGVCSASSVHVVDDSMSVKVRVRLRVQRWGGFRENPACIGVCVHLAHRLGTRRVIDAATGRQLRMVPEFPTTRCD